MNVINNKWIGTRTIRPDGADKVTGRAAYSADTTLPGMIWAKVLRSPHAHAKILSIDTSKAEALPGVKAVVSGKDFVDYPLDKPVMLGIQDIRWQSRNVMAREKVLFHGHPVAAVAAVTEEIAAEACALIEVEYEVLPHVIEIDDAIAPDAPILFDSMTFEGKPSNIASRQDVKLGDIEAGFAQADIVIERRFTTRPIHQGYIEPHACLVSVTADGKATIWSSSQGQFIVRSLSSYITGVPRSDIRAIPAEIGGGFGAKTILYLEPVALLLAKKSGRPVKMAMTRDEVFRATGPTSGSVVTVKIGATKDGRIVAGHAVFHIQAGCFPGGPMRGASACCFGPYDIPNVLATAYDVVSNRSKVAAYRAPGGPIGAFGVESVVDELAQKLGMDPIDLRLLNAAKRGTKMAYGPVLESVGYIDVLEAAKAHPHYTAPLGKFQGRGVASGYWYNAAGDASSQINVTEEGNLVVTTGNPDIGGNRAAIANVTAELFGIDHSRVSVLIGDTATIGYSDITAGSRATFVTSMVVTRSAEKVINTLRERAAKIWKIDVEAVDWVDGEARPAGDNAGRFPGLSLKELAERTLHTDGPIGHGTQQKTVGADGTFGAHICDVEVDMDLGIVRVVRYTSIQDVGRAIHPDYVEGQMQGGAAQGIGWAISEAYLYDKQGRVDNASFLDYRMPVCSDLPMIDTVMVEVPNNKHPQGVKGVGEIALVPPLAAVANAVANALGKRIYDLPLSPPRVLEVIEG